ncbi:MAG: DUF374 domain-containing protein [Deltaproteobacteria bacterium]|nr:DUF374 domain-containing protein [Deltaproteobacteria bacterium]
MSRASEAIAGGPARAGLWIRIKAFAIYLAARVLLATVRIRVRHSRFLAEAQKSGKPVLFAFWHGRQLGLFKANPAERLTVLASLSADGRMQAGICRCFGLEVVRGSSSRGGLAGLLALGRALARGSSVGMAVDGPRGPAFEAKAGICVLARRSAAPILPISIGYRKSWTFGRAWDRFVVPRPFTRAWVGYAEPLRVAPDASRAEMARVAFLLGERLNALTADVDSG